MPRLKLLAESISQAWCDYNSRFFMVIVLTPRQIETLAHLKRAGFSNNIDVINWAKNKLNQSRAHAIHKNRRKHSRKYYQQIIEFLS